VGRFFAEITTKRIRREAFRSVRHLEQAIADYLEEYNSNPKPFQWTATTDRILNRVCQQIADSAH